MAEGARVESIESIRAFRVALIKFAETASVAVDDAEADLTRTLMWLETEQRTYWQNEIRKRAELVERAKEAVRMKKVFKDSSGRTASAVDEEKALALAQRRLAEALGKLEAVKKWTGRLRKEILNYKGLVQRLVTSLQTDVPMGVAQLDQISALLNQYVSLRPGAGGPSSEQIEALTKAMGETVGGSMARAGEVEAKDEGRRMKDEEGRGNQRKDEEGTVAEGDAGRGKEAE